MPLHATAAAGREGGREGEGKLYSVCCVRPPPPPERRPRASCAHNAPLCPFFHRSFPPESYEINYPAPGDPQLADKVCSLLKVGHLLRCCRCFAASAAAAVML